MSLGILYLYGQKYDIVTFLCTFSRTFGPRLPSLDLVPWTTSIYLLVMFDIKAGSSSVGSRVMWLHLLRKEERLVMLLKLSLRIRLIRHLGQIDSGQTAQDRGVWCPPWLSCRSGYARSRETSTYGVVGWSSCWSWLSSNVS